MRINLYNSENPRSTFFFNRANFLRRYSSSGVRLGKPMGRLYFSRKLTKLRINRKIRHADSSAILAYKDMSPR